MIGGYANMTLKRKTWAVRLSLVFLLMAITVLMAAGISAATETNLGATGKVNSWDGAYVRAKATKSSDIVTGYKDNTKVDLKREIFVTGNKTGAKYKWYRITKGKKSGYIRSDLIDTVKYKTTATGKTTAKIIHQHRESMPSKSSDHGNQLMRIFHIGAFRDFQFQHLGLQIVFFNQGLQVVQQILTVEIQP